MKNLKWEEYKGRFFDIGEKKPENCVLKLAEQSDCMLPAREPVSHKYSYGRALLIGGKTGYSGAPVLAANACERSGAGLTQLVVPDSIYAVAASRCDGAVVTPAQSDESGGFSAKALDTVLPLLTRADACVIGPGIGTGEGTGKLITEMIRKAECPLVLDADALTYCGRNPEVLQNCRAPLILTPHEGEFRKLGGNLSEGRLAGAQMFTAAHENIILILKGYGTLVGRDRAFTVNPTGGPAMAKGGSGDVLCGILCGLLSQGFDTLFSSWTAVYLHGLAGDMAAAEVGEYSVTPSDLIRFLPKAFVKVHKIFDANLSEKLKL